MAQTKERTQPAAKSPPKAVQRTTPPAPAPKAPPAPLASARNWLSRLRGPLTNAPGPNGKPQQRAGGTIFKSFFGILIWFVASQFIMYGLILLDSVLPRVNGLPMLESTHLLPPNTPLLGWITPFLLLYGGAVIGLWFLLIRLKLIPRDFRRGRFGRGRGWALRCLWGCLWGCLCRWLRSFFCLRHPVSCLCLT